MHISLGLVIGVRDVLFYSGIGKSRIVITGGQLTGVSCGEQTYSFEELCASVC